MVEKKYRNIWIAQKGSSHTLAALREISQPIHWPCFRCTLFTPPENLPNLRPATTGHSLSSLLGHVNASFHLSPTLPLNLTPIPLNNKSHNSPKCQSHTTSHSPPAQPARLSVPHEPYLYNPTTRRLSPVAPGHKRSLK